MIKQEEYKTKRAESRTYVAMLRCGHLLGPKLISKAFCDTGKLRYSELEVLTCKVRQILLHVKSMS